MNRWNTKLENVGDKFTMLLEPNVDEMSKFMVEASQNLTKQIMEAEEKLCLQCVSKAGLKRLIKLCQTELERRKK